MRQNPSDTPNQGCQSKLHQNLCTAFAQRIYAQNGT